MKRKLLKTFALWLLAGVSLYGQDTVYVTGCAKFWQTQEPIPGVTYSVSINHPQFPQGGGSGQAGPNEGCATFGVPLNPNPPSGTTITSAASRQSNDWLNGVTIIDLVQISLHILGLQPLSAPWGMVAADANRSGAITTFDIVETRKLILGVYSELPNAPNWAFYPESCTFINPANPFMGLNCPPIPQLNNGDSLGFIGIKIGDVDGDADLSVTPNPLLVPDDTLTVYLPDWSLQAGQEVIVPFWLEQPATQQGAYQFEFQYDTATLELYTPVPGFWGGEWALFPTEGRIRHVSFLVTPDTLARLAIRAKTSLNVRQALTLTQVQFPPIFYDAAGTTHLLEAFDLASPVAAPAASAWRVTASPNPFTQTSSLEFFLDRPEVCVLEIFDLAGRRSYRSEQALPAGQHRLSLPETAVSPGTTGFYRLTDGRRQSTGRLVRQP